jgi:Carboxypeptidase regulatory-like domain
VALRIALFFLSSVISFGAQANAGDTRSSMEGVVVDGATGEPLRKAYVQLSDERGSRSSTRVVSGSDGRFAASGLDPGEYKVHVERQGYLDCDCLSGVRISTGQKLTGVRVKLKQYSAISGKVVDSDGDPWPRGSVEVYRLAWNQGKRKLQQQDQADVDDRGVFRVGKIPAGRYFLAAQPDGQSPASYQTSFYPGSLEPSAAVPLQLAEGQEVTGIVIKLQSAPTYSIRGRVNGLDMTEFNGRTAGSRLSMGIYRTSGLFEDRLDAQLNRQPDGTFEFCGVPSGSYTIRISSMSGGFTPSRWATQHSVKTPYRSAGMT